METIKEEFDEVVRLTCKVRRTLVSDLKKIFEPRMWESGYRIGPIGNSRPMKLWVHKDKNGNLSEVRFSGDDLTTFCGVSENGVITDVDGGGCVTESWSSFSIEDLMMLKEWALKQPQLAQPTQEKPAARRVSKKSV